MRNLVAPDYGRIDHRAVWNPGVGFCRAGRGVAPTPFEAAVSKESCLALDVGIAADLMWLYKAPLLYDKPVHEGRWSLARFQAWLTEALQVQLLGKRPDIG